MSRKLLKKELESQEMVHVNFKVSSAFKDRLIAIAGADHRTLSSLMIKVVADYLSANSGGFGI